MSPLAEGLVTAEFARGDGSFGTFSVHSGLAMTTIDLLGYHEQKERWLPDLAACTKLGAFALTEPDHGSDAVRTVHHARSRRRPLRPRRRQTLDRLGTFADVVVVWARDDDGQRRGFVIDHRDHDPHEPTPG